MVASITLETQAISWLNNAKDGDLILLRIHKPKEGYATLERVSQEKLSSYYNRYSDEQEGMIEILISKYTNTHPSSGIMQKTLLSKEMVYGGVEPNVVDDYILKAFHKVRDLKPSDIKDAN